MGYKQSSSYTKHQAALAEWKKSESNKPFGKDPNRPKRAPSAYLLFVNNERPGLMAKGLSVTEVASAAAKLWGAMSDGSKKKWNDQAATAKAKQEKVLAKYMKSADFKKYEAEKAEFDAKRKE